MEQSQNTNNTKKTASTMPVAGKAELEKLLSEENQYPKFLHASTILRRMYTCPRKLLYDVQKEERQ